VGRNLIRIRAGARARASSRRGFSLVEVAILALLLLVGVGGLSSAVLSSVRLARSTEESALADEAARALGARMQAVTFRDIFATYNGYPDDDPGGVPGSAPGSAFDVRGLTPRTDDPDGRVGRIVFPVVELMSGAEALREDVVDPRLGMAAGRDLNGDLDQVDDATGDYQILPARLIVEWTGAGGNRSYELDLVLVQ
jgi:hypothetical protein